jgi:hypothetical protein
VHLVAVCHQLRPEAFVAKLQSLASGCGITLRGVVVSNNAAHAWTAMPREPEILRGSNRLLDFSGYFEGLDHLRVRHPKAVASNVLFVNDTLVTKHAAACILGRVLGMDALVGSLRVPAMSGKLDPYRAICMRNPWSGHSSYITSFCFLLNSLALPLMQQLTADAQADGVLGGAEIGDLSWGRQLPDDFREMLRAHLLYPDSPFLWPAARSSSSDLLRRKASSSYFEHRLSGHLGRSGVVVPINAGPRSIASIAVSERTARLSRAIGAKMGFRW